jgi:formiminoglutamase
MYENWFKTSVVYQEDFSDKHSIGYQIQTDPDTSINMGTKVALLGYDPETADVVRRDLFHCSFNFNQLQLIDLGNLRKKENDFVVPILDELKKAGLNLIVIGADENFREATHMALEDEHRIVYVEKSGKNLFSKNDLDFYVKEEKVKKIKLVGYQSHLFHKDKLKHKKLNQSLSLGDIRNNMRDSEPVLRDVNTMHFMLDSIRYSELPGIKDTSPSGLTSEEACQLMRYFGLNPLRNCLSIFGYDPKYDFHSQGVKMMSQLIWYYLEGLDQKKFNKTESKENMAQYVVELNDYNLSLSFWKSDYSGRWWVEIPEEDGENIWLPCSYLDYKMACNNEMPKRILNELQ